TAPLSAQSVKAGIEAWQHADYAAAVAIWRPLAENGDADAAFNLGQAYRLGRGVPLSLGSAQSWFLRAAQTGHVDAQTTLGLLLFQNGDQVQGLKWLKAAAVQGEPRALLVYGTALYNGDGVAQDKILGYAYVSRSAAAGLAPAKETLSQLDGLMAPDDRAKAIAMSRAIPTGSPVSARPSNPVAVAEANPPKQSTPKPVTPKPVAPKPKPQPPKPKPVATSPVAGDWRIQLGAFSQRGSAEALYQRVSGKAALAGRRPIYVPAGNVIRLQVGPFVSRAAAQGACGSLGVACFPVPAK
ncbi:MAG: SPOR domain-containing protein, partial [Sphingomonas sp.]|nr:SPOR domain-containing protein [Sphingomonas sp.]